MEFKSRPFFERFRELTQDEESELRAVRFLSAWVVARLTRVLGGILFLFAVVVAFYCRVYYAGHVASAIAISSVALASLSIVCGMLYYPLRWRLPTPKQVLFLTLAAACGLVAGYRRFEGVTIILYLLPFAYMPLFMWLSAESTKAWRLRRG